MGFEWDDTKAVANRHKHGISFQEAQTVFDDSRVVVRYDNEHSAQESRYRAIGISRIGRLLLVCVCRRNNKTIRIISARKATAEEVQDYGETNV